MSDTVSTHDVFISYAHIDNQPGRGVKYGWVSNLHYGLENALSRQLGGHCSIWFDQSELRGNHSVSPEIASKLAHAQTLVLVLSRSYIQSEWCLKELALFRSQISEADAGRIFVVDIAAPDREQLRAIGLGELATYQFWYRDENKRIRVYGTPEPRPEQGDYYRLIDDIATDIADLLKKCNCAKSHPRIEHQNEQALGLLNLSGFETANINRIQGSEKTIVLAEVTDDLVSLRQQLRRHLQQAGYSVRMCDSYGTRLGAFECELRGYLREARLFVQLLSHVSSRPLSELPEGYAIWQHRIAVDCKVKIMQWRDPGVVPKEINYPDYRVLLLQDSVYAVPFEGFKRLVVDAMSEPSNDYAPSSVNPFIFINAEKRDFPLAAQIRKFVGQHVATSLPIESGKPEDIRRDIEESIIDCDGLLVVYGDGSAAWVHQQLRLFNKLSPQRERPIKLLAVIEEPPDGKPDINVQIPGMRILDCRAGISEAALHKVFADISPGWRQ